MPMALQKASHRVICRPSARASSFPDPPTGVAGPSNEGRGYVLRRIIAPAPCATAQLLGAKETVDVAAGAGAGARDGGKAYPELVRAEGLISETLKLEETRFSARPWSAGLADPG